MGRVDEGLHLQPNAPSIFPLSHRGANDSGLRRSFPYRKFKNGTCRSDETTIYTAQRSAFNRLASDVQAYQTGTDERNLQQFIIDDDVTPERRTADRMKPLT